MDRFTFDTASLGSLARINPAAHQEQLALGVLRTVWRRRWLVLFVGLCTGAAALGALQLQPPRYKAEAIVELNVGRSDPAAAGLSPSSVVVEASSVVLSEAKIIRSPLVLQRTVKALDLTNDPQFSGDGAIAKAVAWFRRTVLHEPAPPPDLRQRQAQAEQTLASGLTVETDNRSYLITIGFTAHSAEEAARVANGVAEQYLASRLETAQDAASRMVRWIDAQIQDAQTQLQTNQAAIDRLRRESGLMDLGSQDTSQQQIQEASTQLGAATIERIAEENRLARLKAAPGGAAADLQDMPQVRGASDRAAAARQSLADLQSRFGPRHPAVVHAQSQLDQMNAAVAEEVGRAIAGLQASVAAHRATEQQLQDRLRTLQQNVANVAPQRTQIQTLQAAENNLHDRLLTLRGSRDRAMAAPELRAVPASLSASAQPPRRAIETPPALIGALGLGFGLVLGTIIASLLERIDRGFYTTAEVSEATELRCLGTVPSLRADDELTTSPTRRARTDAQLVFDESIRLVASGLGLFGSDNGGGRIVLVTSSVPDEGRSELCAGLARSLWLSGRRVLLIDGPPRRFEQRLRRRRFRRMDKNRPPELSDPSLVVLRRNAAAAWTYDVFSSPRWAEALQQARKQFDVVVVEGPPVMLMADSLVLGRLADTVIHAACWGRTKKRTVRAALRRMQEHGVSVDGVALTRVDRARHARLKLDDQNSSHFARQGYYQASPAALQRPALPGLPAATKPQVAGQAAQQVSETALPEHG